MASERVSDKDLRKCIALARDEATTRALEELQDLRAQTCGSRIRDLGLWLEENKKRLSSARESVARLERAVDQIEGDIR